MSAGMRFGSPVTAWPRERKLWPAPAGGLRTILRVIRRPMTRTRGLLRRGFALEYVTLGWNVAGIVVLAHRSGLGAVSGAGRFGLDSLIEIGASTAVTGTVDTGEERQRRGLRLIGSAFAALAVYLLAQSTVVAGRWLSPAALRAWHHLTAVTAAVMFAPTAGKTQTGRALDNPVLQTEGRVTMIDAILATAVLLGLTLNACSAGGGPTPPPDTSWSSMPPVRYARSSQRATEAGRATPVHLMERESSSGGRN